MDQKDNDPADNTDQGDNAGGGRRGHRATPSPQLFEALQDRYGIQAPKDIRDLGGSSSLNMLMVGGHGPCVVRVYRPYVTPARLRDIQKVRGHLAHHGVPCSEVIPTRDGQPWLVFEDRLVEAEPYVVHDAVMDTWDRLRRGLRRMGRIHTLLQGMETSADGKAPAFANHIKPQDALARTLRGTGRIRGWDPSPDERRLADAAEELATLLNAAEQAFAARCPIQLTHGDFWDNNVFFRHGAVVLVNDFDFMGERARIDDLALTLYFAGVTFLTGRSPATRLRKLRSLVDAYDVGLDEPLSSIERAALPLAIARQPLWSIGGWVALLDDESRARLHAQGMHTEVAWALGIVHHLETWQEAFA